jgi:beta-glucosidase
MSGTDLECGSEYKNLPAAVKRGDISEAQINTSLRRLLTARFELGDFDSDELVEWTKIPSSVIASKEHKQLALQMAREGVVLLKNNGCLPLSPTKGKGNIIVMGPNANDSIMQWGNYSGYATQTVTVLEGLRQQLGNVPYIQGCALTRNEVLESRFDKMQTPDGGKGIRAYYWNNTEMKGDPVTSVVITEPINLSNGGNTVFAPGVNLENFSGRYLGTLIPTEDEALILKVGADDKVRVIVNGDTLVDIWKVRQRIQEAQPTLNVKKGESYRIQIDYVQEGGMAAMQFDVCKKQNPTRQQLLAQIGQAETVVFVGGISPRVEGEEMKVSDPGFKGGDRTDIELPQVQRDMLRMLHEAGKKVVFVNCSGGAMAMVPELETCDAIIQGWYGGERGGQAIAEVIMGKVNPSGKLPMTFYKSVNDLPDFLDYTMKNRTYRYFKGEALFPFGYGLSYTTFDISKPAYKNNKVQFTIKNTGNVDGTEVVQVYVRNTADKEGPLKTLRAYQRVTLKAGEARMMSIDFPRERFEGWDAKTNTMRVVPGKYEIMLGSSSADKDLKRITVNIK